MSRMWVGFVLAGLVSTGGAACAVSHPPKGTSEGADPASTGDAGGGAYGDARAPEPAPHPTPVPGPTPGGGPDPADRPPPTDPRVPTTPGGIGAACTSDGDCSLDGATCLASYDTAGFSIEFPGGYCTRACTSDSGDRECGVGNVCFTLPMGPATRGGTCLKTCETDAQCRPDEGYACQDLPFLGRGARFCVPPFGGFGGGGFGGGRGGDRGGDDEPSDDDGTPD